MITIQLLRLAGEVILVNSIDVLLGTSCISSYTTEYMYLRLYNVIHGYNLFMDVAKPFVTCLGFYSVIIQPGT